MLLTVDDSSAPTVLGAAKAVATASGRDVLSDNAADAISSLARLGLGVEAPEIGTLAEPSPDKLSATLTDIDQCATLTEILAVVALGDGTLDAGRIEAVLRFADALDVDDDWLSDLAMSLEPDLQLVIADMGRNNLRSVTDGRLDLSEIDDINAWLLPYGEQPDAALAERYRSLTDLPLGTLGHEFWAFYVRHQFAFPGEAGAVNEIFGTPHDCTHVISGYDTTPQGELLTSTFTARMHPVYPMSGHVLPVIYSWHLGIEFNRLAGSYRGALDPAKLWVAWDRGLRTAADTFDPSFTLWDRADMPLAEVRDAFGVVPLDPAHAASSNGAVAGIDYHPIA